MEKSLHSLKETIADVFKKIRPQYTLNALLLNKVLSDQGVEESVINAVTDSLQQEMKGVKPDEIMLETVFARYDIKSLAATTYAEMEKAPIAPVYGALAMF